MIEKADPELASIYIRLYFDEDVPAGIPKSLRTRGFDVLSAREVDTLRRSDDEQLKYAVDERRTIVSHNLVDFEQLHGEWVASGQDHFGIIVAKRRPRDEIVVRKLLDLLDSVTGEEMNGQLRYI